MNPDSIVRRRRALLALLALATLVAGSAAAFVRHAHVSVLSPSRRDLRAGFARATRRMVIAWGERDTRSPREQQEALFGVVYSTYESSAWIPQSLFDSNVVTQAIVGDAPTIVGQKVGLVLWPDTPLVPAFGMAPSVDSHEP